MIDPRSLSVPTRLLSQVAHGIWTFVVVSSTVPVHTEHLLRDNASAEIRGSGSITVGTLESV